MANYRKKHRKKVVRCTMCTPFKWLGNSKDRTKRKYRLDKTSMT